MPTVSDSYATAAEYRTGISPNKVDTSADGEILNDLTAVSRWLERRLGRFFTKDAAAVARDYYGPSAGPVYPEAENPYKFAGAYSRTLDLGTDLVSVTTLISDDGGVGPASTTSWTSWTANTDYQLLPLNADKGPEPRPYNALYVPTYSGKLGWPPTRLVRVTGIWGWPAVPASIKRGVINLTAILRLETPTAISRVDSLGTVVSATPQARAIVDDLVRVYLRTAI